MKFKIIPMKSKDYGVTVWGSPIENFREWKELITHYDIMAGTSSDNQKYFPKLLGKKSFQWTGEFRFDCWLVDLETTKVLVLTAREKGTCYEVITHREGNKIRKDPVKVIQFIKWISSVHPERKKYEKFLEGLKCRK